MTREEKIAAALLRVRAAEQRFGHTPEGACMFLALWTNLAKEADNILRYDHLTTKASL